MTKPVWPIGFGPALSASGGGAGVLLPQASRIHWSANSRAIFMGHLRGPGVRANESYARRGG